MSLDHVRRTYERLGAQHPLWAVLSDNRKSGNLWNPDEFFALGRREITQLVADLDARGLLPPERRGDCLDFGCGVGRLSQALADHFQRVTGVDISDTMIDGAGRFNRHGDRVRYLVNTEPDLALLPGRSFDFIYSNITLQHVPPRFALGYVAEFVRLLKPDGLAVFTIPDGPIVRPGTLRARWYDFYRGAYRRFRRRLAGRPPVEIHYVAHELVRERVAAAGGATIDTRHEPGKRGRRGRCVYYVTPAAPPEPRGSTP